MIKDALNIYWLPLGRVLAGFVVGLLLAVLGGWAGLFLNLLIGYPWSLAVHQNIQMVAIGVGAGLGTYLAWFNSTLRWYWILGALVLVLTGSTIGAYLGLAYGPGVVLVIIPSRIREVLPVLAEQIDSTLEIAQRPGVGVSRKHSGLVAGPVHVLGHGHGLGRHRVYVVGEQAPHHARL